MKENDQKILLVDDTEEHVQLIKSNLREGGIDNEILAFHCGESFLDFFFQNDFSTSLILLSVDMPGLTGVEVLKRVRSDERYLSTPIIMLGKHDDLNSLNICYHLGCTEFITKHFDNEKFALNLKRLALCLKSLGLITKSKTCNP